VRASSARALVARSIGVIQVDWWQVAYLTFRDAETHAVAEFFHGADWNGD
jgi:hypothetical protein